jgi:uncharacterized membrane protein YvlD (DUF360 family)
VIRLLLSALVRLLANAVGLLVAAWALEDMTMTNSAFVIAVLIFTVVEVLVDPLLTKIALTSATALRGSVALITTFVGLLVTTLLTDGMNIEGFTTWVLATLIVWLAALLAALLLPLILLKKHREEKAA